MSKVDLFAAHRDSMNSALQARGGKPKFWRSLDSLQDRDQTQRWMDEEFPNGLAPKEFGEVTHDGQESKPGFVRREMLKLMGASMAFAGVGAGCVRRPEEEILPYVSMPEEIIPGIPNFYATAMPSPWGALGVVVESHDGRPTKVEGNPDHPSSQGKTGVFAQASVLQMYDPERSRGPLKAGTNGLENSTWDEFEKDFGGMLTSAGANQGTGLAFLLDANEGPTRTRLVKAIRAKLPSAKFFQHDVAAATNTAAGADMAFGAGARVHVDIEKANVICAIDSDFLTAGPDHVRHSIGYGKKRNATMLTDSKSAKGMNRLYAVEPGFSATGASADNRLRVAGRDIPAFLLGLADALSKVGVGISGAPGFKSNDEKFMAALAKDLKANSGKALLVVGERQPAAVHAFAQEINAALGAFASGLCRVTKSVRTKMAPLADLVRGLETGGVDQVVIIGSNPGQTGPAVLNFAQSLSKAKMVIHAGLYADETARLCHWHIPAAHYLEAWADAVSHDGTVSIVQPLIQPIFGGRAANVILASFAGEKGSDLDLVKKTHGLGSSGWRKALHTGVVKNARSSASATPSGSAAGALRGMPQKLPTAGDLDVVFRLDAKVLDGRYANLSWMQELPDPMTKLTWGNALLVGPSTARELGIKSRVFKNSYEADEVTLTVDGRSVNLPAFVLPGMAPFSVEVSVGYGRGDAAGVVADGHGVDVYPLLPADGSFIAPGSLKRTGEIIELASTQDHFAIDGEPIQEGEKYAIGQTGIQELRRMNDGYAKKRPLTVSTDAQGYQNDDKFAKASSLRVLNDKLVNADALKERPTGPDKPIQPTNSFPYNDEEDLDQMFISERMKKRWGASMQWGMVIDLSACTGCNACVVACQAENNIPVVGKEMVLMGREMHWLRIDRYFTGDVDNPEAVSQPLGCLHCENAPCEPVCPVAATVHDSEGLNGMIYNRCIGTRYCANNCPVKVRRFNYKDFTNTAHIVVEPKKVAERKRYDVLKLQRNPDVSVRFRGVIEKCTYCTQRIQEAKLVAKRAGEDSKNLPDGAVTPACAQTCPTSAITFGNINDEKSAVAKMKRLDRNYEMLNELNIRPRTSYIARIKNPNPELG